MVSTLVKTIDALRETEEKVESTKPIKAPGVESDTGSYRFDDASVMSTNSDAPEIENCVFGERAEMIMSKYDDTGSQRPKYPFKSPISEFPAHTESDEQSGQFQATFPNPTTAHAVRFKILPREVGIGVFVIKDTDENGCTLNTRTEIEITAGDVSQAAANIPLEFPLKNRIKVRNTQTTWISYEGPALAGRNYVGDATWGTQFVPWLTTISHPWEDKDIALLEDIPTHDDFLTKTEYDTNDNGKVDNADNSDLLEGNNSAYHLDRTNHTGNQSASTISDFDTEVENNSQVSANTTHRNGDGTDHSGLIPNTEKGAALGVAELDGGGTVPVSQLPNSVQGGIRVVAFWDADLNVPDLTTLSLNQGEAYQVSTAGNTNINGEANWLARDLVVWSDTLSGNWFKIDNTDDVLSVAGKTGAVLLNTGDVSETSKLYYTESRVSNNVSVAANTAKRSYPLADENRLANTSGTNTGDQDLSGLQPKPSEGPFVDGDKAKLDNQSGTNTGDVTLNAGSPTQDSASLVGQVLELKQATPATDGVLSSEDKTHLDNIVANGGGDGWVSGFDTSENSPKGTSILYGAGTYLINGDDKAIASSGVYDLANGFGSVNHYSGMINDQHALVGIYVDTDEVIKSIRGDVGEKGQVIFPPLQPVDSVCIAEVEIKVNSSGTPKEIDNKHIFDCRTSPSLNTDETVSASVNDTTTGYLIDKISSSGNVAATIENPGGDEKIILNASVGGGGVDPSITYTGTANIDGLDVSSLSPSGILWINSTADIELRSLQGGVNNQVVRVINMTLKKLRFKIDTGTYQKIYTEGAADIIADKYGGQGLVYNSDSGHWHYVGVA
jgi:hypothetical protein